TYSARTKLCESGCDGAGRLTDASGRAGIFTGSRQPNPHFASSPTVAVALRQARGKRANRVRGIREARVLARPVKIQLHVDALAHRASHHADRGMGCDLLRAARGSTDS